MKLSPSDFISIVSILVSLIFGGGWLTSYLQAKKKYKKDFLIPIQMILKQNKRIFEELTNAIDLQALEYAPDYIQQKINELEDSNPIKGLWLLRIKTLMANNDMVIIRITENIGAVKNNALKQELEKFIFHAQKFNSIWTQIQSTNQVEPGINRDTDLLSEEYPSDLDRFIREEIGKN